MINWFLPATRGETKHIAIPILPAARGENMRNYWDMPPGEKVLVSAMASLENETPQPRCPLRLR